jgi:sialate O-acetylesterase
MMKQVPSDLDCWVLAGQSNMEGCGLLAHALPPDERVWSFTTAGHWETATEPLHRFWESYTSVHERLIRPNLQPERQHLSNAELAKRDAKERDLGAGLGISFGKTIADSTGRPVGLIPSAHGGTSLDQWSPRGKAEGGATLYGAMLDRIKRAGGKLRGILWYQGESDCNNIDNACGTYLSRMQAWIEAARRDTGHPDLPVHLVQLGCMPVLPSNRESPSSWEKVREALLRLPTIVPHCSVTSAIDLGLDDGIHINSEGLVRLGRRIARQVLKMERGENTVGPQVVRIETVAARTTHGAVRIVCTGVEGSWRPTEHMSGFTARTPDGLPHPQNMVLNARPDPADPQHIRVLLNAPPHESCRVAYGMGFSPYCNVVDEADMPLCAFSQMANGG